MSCEIRLYADITMMAQGLPHQNFIIVLFDDKTIISTIICGDFPLSNNFVNIFPLSHSHVVCRNTQTLKIRHYCCVYIINVKCFTENITKECIVGSYMEV